MGGGERLNAVADELGLLLDELRSSAVLDYLISLEPAALADPIAAVRAALTVVIPTRHPAQGGA